MTRYLLVGNGRLALHFREYFRHLRLSFETWSRQENSISELSPLLTRAERILLLISDSSLTDFVKEHRTTHPEAIWIQFSGALETPGAESFHPLMTFGPKTYELSTYLQMPFVTTSSFPLSQALPGLENPCVKISADQKARYHALCVLSGNFSMMLWKKMIDELQHWNLGKDIALPYARQCVDNIFADPKHALTGPLVRGDQVTQNKNLEALKGDPFAEIYRSFQRIYSGGASGAGPREEA